MKCSRLAWAVVSCTESPNFSAANVPFPRASDPRRSRYVSQGTRAAGGAVGAQARRTW